VQAILNAQLEEHVQAGTCAPAIDPSEGALCPLCAQFVGPGKEGWVQHLLKDGCPANPRKVPVQ